MVEANQQPQRGFTLSDPLGDPYKDRIVFKF
jgi:hypothetical protein